MTSTDKKYEMFESRFSNPEERFILYLRRLYPNFTQELANEVYKQHGKEGYEEQKSCDEGDTKEEQAVATNMETLSLLQPLYMWLSWIMLMDQHCTIVHIHSCWHQT